MNQTRTKVGVLIEADYYEKEIAFYREFFPAEGMDLHFMSRLWGQEQLVFHGHEDREPLTCTESFEGMDDATLDSFAAIIVPAGYAADRLRYTEDIHKLPPAVEFMQRAFERPHVVKGIICHGLWLLAPVPELVRGRKVVVHNNLLGDAKNMGAVYVDQDVVVDDDLITARTGDCHQAFAETILKYVRE